MEVDDLYEELDRLEKETDVHAVVSQLKEKLPSENGQSKAATPV